MAVHEEVAVALERARFLTEQTRRKRKRKEEEEADASDLLMPLSLPRSSSTTAVARSRLGFLQFTLCSLLTSAGLSCQASLSVWSRMTVCARRRLRQWHMLGWFYWYFSSRCGFCCRLQAAPWPLWTRRTVTPMCKAWFAGILHTAMCSSSRCQAHDALHHGRMNQRNSYVATFWRTCLLNTITSARGPDRGFSAVAVHQVRRHFLRDAVAHPHGPCDHIPQMQFLNEVIDVPGMQVVQVLPSRCPLCATTSALHSCSLSTRLSSSLSWRRGISP